MQNYKVVLLEYTGLYIIKVVIVFCKEKIPKFWNFTLR